MADPLTVHERVLHTLRTEGEAMLALAEGLNTDESQRLAWSKAVELLIPCQGHLVVSGMGKSGLVGAKISATCSSLGLPSSFLHPSEAVHGDLGRIGPEDVALQISNSGGTAEVVDLALHLRTDGVPTIGMSAHDDSPLAESVSVHLRLAPPDATPDEACPWDLAPTTSTTLQLAAGDALALAAAEGRGFGPDEFARRHPGGALGAALRPIGSMLRFRVGAGVEAIPSSTPIRTALRTAREASQGRRSGALLLTDEHGVLEGIMTDGDLRRLLLDNPEAIDGPSAESMTKNPRTLQQDQPLREAERLVRTHRVDEIPIVDAEGRPVGLLDVQDLITLKIVRDPS